MELILLLIAVFLFFLVGLLVKNTEGKTHKYTGAQRLKLKNT